MHPPFPPRCARRFRPEKLIASGGFGSVWHATQVDLGRLVAVKLLHDGILEEEDQRERFVNEARVTAALSHPSIVKIVDHDVEDGIPWIAYEYLPGLTLRERLERERPMPWRMAAQAACQVAGALEEAHQRGVLHRDVKPDNVIGDFRMTCFDRSGYLADGRGAGTGFRGARSCEPAR